MRRYGSFFDCPRMAILIHSVIPGKDANYQMQTEVKCINKKKCTREIPQVLDLIIRSDRLRDFTLMPEHTRDPRNTDIQTRDWLFELQADIMVE